MEPTVSRRARGASGGPNRPPEALGSPRRSQTTPGGPQRLQEAPSSPGSHMLVSKIKPCMSQYKLLHGDIVNGSLEQL